MKIKCGRIDRRGTNTTLLGKFLDGNHGVEGVTTYRLPNIGHPRREVGKRRISIATFIKYHSTGTFYCLVKGHALAIVNGVVKDSFTNRGGRLINAAWRVL